MYIIELGKCVLCCDWILKNSFIVICICFNNLLILFFGNIDKEFLFWEFIFDMY